MEKLFKRVGKWIGHIFDDKIEGMATKVYSISKILDDLNKDLPSKLWMPIDGVFLYSQGKVDTINKKVNPELNNLVIKSFINKETGEVRSYLAKWLEDEPETAELP